MSQDVSMRQFLSSSCTASVTSGHLYKECVGPSKCSIKVRREDGAPEAEDGAEIA